MIGFVRFGLRAAFLCFLLVTAAPAWAEEASVHEDEGVEPHEPTQLIDLYESRLADKADAVTVHNLAVAQLRSGHAHAGIARLAQARLAAPGSDIIRRHLRDAADHHGVDEGRLEMIEAMALALRWRNGLLIAGAVSFWIGLAGWVFVGRDAFRWIRTLSAGFCFVGAAAFGGGAYLHGTCPTADDYLSFQETTALRAAPAARSPVTASVPALEILTARGVKDRWLFVEGSGRNTGWVREDLVLPLLLQN